MEKEKLKLKKLRQKIKDRLHSIEVEVKLADCNVEIIRCLQAGKTKNEAACIQTLTEVEKLPLTSVMLIRNPDIVCTMKRVRFYKPNHDIQMKAATCYGKFRALFAQPEDKNFIATFKKEVRKHLELHPNDSDYGGMMTSSSSDDEDRQPQTAVQMSDNTVTTNQQNPVTNQNFTDVEKKATAGGSDSSNEGEGVSGAEPAVQMEVDDVNQNETDPGRDLSGGEPTVGGVMSTESAVTDSSPSKHRLKDECDASSLDAHVVESGGGDVPSSADSCKEEACIAEFEQCNKFEPEEREEVRATKLQSDEHDGEAVIPFDQGDMIPFGPTSPDYTGDIASPDKANSSISPSPTRLSSDRVSEKMDTDQENSELSSDCSGPKTPSFRPSPQRNEENYGAETLDDRRVNDEILSEGEMHRSYSSDELQQQSHGKLSQQAYRDDIESPESPYHPLPTERRRAKKKASKRTRKHKKHKRHRSSSEDSSEEAGRRVHLEDVSSDEDSRNVGKQESRRFEERAGTDSESISVDGDSRNEAEPKPDSEKEEGEIDSDEEV